MMTTPLEADTSNLQELRLDLTSPDAKAVAECAGRLASLLKAPALSANPNEAACYDDLLGAVYALAFAQQLGFQDRSGKAIELGAVQVRAEMANEGVIRTNGRWLAGFHFNNALFRLAAVQHRILKLVAEIPDSRLPVPALLSAASNRYAAWTKNDWVHHALKDVHSEVNGLKHTPAGIYAERLVSFKIALAAIDEILTLIEAWTSSRSTAAGV